MSYRWAVLAAGTTAQAAFSTVSFAIAVLAPALRDRYDLTLTEVGIVLGAEWVGLTFALLPWGFAVDRFGERWTLAGGLAGCAAFLAAAAYAPSFAWLVVLLGLAGAAGGSVQSGSGRAVMGWFAARERGFALGVRQTAVPIGGAVAALVLPLLPGPRAGFLFVAAFVLVGAAVGALVLRSGAEEHLEASDVESTLRDRRLWLACWGSGLYLIAQVAMMGFVVLFLHDEHGFSTGQAAAAIAIPIQRSGRTREPSTSDQRPTEIRSTAASAWPTANTAAAWPVEKPCSSWRKRTTKPIIATCAIR